MTRQRLLVALSWVGTLAAQTFIQMSDPQFGMFTKNASFEHETVNLEFAIAHANRLKPAFVVITGDPTAHEYLLDVVAGPDHRAAHQPRESAAARVAAARDQADHVTERLSSVARKWGVLSGTRYPRSTVR